MEDFASEDMNWVRDQLIGTRYTLDFERPYFSLFPFCNLLWLIERLQIQRVSWALFGKPAPTGDSTHEESDPDKQFCESLVFYGPLAAEYNPGLTFFSHNKARWLENYSLFDQPKYIEPDLSGRKAIAEILRMSDASVKLQCEIVELLRQRFEYATKMRPHVTMLERALQAMQLTT